MQKRMVNCSRIIVPILLLSLNTRSYGAAAYIPQALRECISSLYRSLNDIKRKKDLEELYSVITENRMLTSENTVRRAVRKALDIVKADEDNFAQPAEIVEYLEEYLENLHDKSVVLSLKGNNNAQEWPLEVVNRSMKQEREAFDIVRLSNELSSNFNFCGAGADCSLDARVTRKLNSSPFQDPSIIFPPSVMTNSILSAPPIMIGGTGITSAVVNAWALPPASGDPINLQFIIPDDFAKHKKVSLELAVLVPSNGLPNGYANFQVQAKYLKSSHSYNPEDINWTHTSTSGNVKITEASTSGNAKYMLIKIPLKRSHIKRGYFALLSISRILPTGSKTEYAGDIDLVTAVFNYTSKQ
jgi:hypothetical protein